MKKIKVNLDRPHLSSEKIDSKQDFDKVLSGSEKLKIPIWKKIWFYGPIGVSTVLFLITIGVDKEISNSKIQIDDKTITLKDENILPEDTKCIHNPLGNLDHKFQTFTINSSLEQTIKLPSGTQILIPKGSLIADSSYKVELKIREFQTKAESFVAGIPMDYKENSSFESAGMIEIRGWQGDREVLITPSKPIKISMTLYKNPINFEFWKLDESKKEWFNYTAKFKKNDEKKPENSKISYFVKIEKQLIETRKLLKEKDQKKLDLKEPNLIEFNLPIKENQHFDLDFNTKEFPELEKFKGMEFEVVSNKAYDKSFTKKSWSDVVLIKESDSYYAIFSSKKDKLKIGVRPVLNGGRKEIAEMEFSKSFEFYKKTKNELENEAKLLTIKKNTQQARYDELLKSMNEKSVIDAENKMNISSISVKENFNADFTISSFGVYNCDKPTSYPEPFEKEIVFSFNNSNPVEIITAYVFDENKNTRFSFGLVKGHKINDLGCFDGDKNTLLVVDREGKLGYVLNFNSSKINNGILRLTLLDKKDQKLDFIEKLIQGNSIES